MSARNLQLSNSSRLWNVWSFVSQGVSLGGQAPTNNFAESSKAQTLPEELLDQIVAELGNDRAALASCTLVCRSWYYPSASILHQDLFVRNSPANLWNSSRSMLPGFYTALKSSPRLSAHLQRLSLSGSLDFLLLQGLLLSIQPLAMLKLQEVEFLKLAQSYAIPTNPTLVNTLVLRGKPEKPRSNSLNPTLLDVLVWFSKITVLQLHSMDSAGSGTLLRMRSKDLSVCCLYLSPDSFMSWFQSKYHEYMDLSELKNFVVPALGLRSIPVVNQYLAHVGSNLERVGIGLYAHKSDEREEITITPALLQARLGNVAFSAVPNLTSLHLQFHFDLAGDFTNLSYLCGIWQYCFESLAFLPITLNLGLKCTVLGVDGKTERTALLLVLLHSLDWSVLEKLAAKADLVGEQHDVRLTLMLRDGDTLQEETTQDHLIALYSTLGAKLKAIAHLHIH